MTATIDPQHAADLYDSTDGATAGPWTRIAEQHQRTSRWLEYRHLVVADPAGQHYGLIYAIGLTENQEHDLPWDETDEPLPLVRLYPHQVTTTVYRTDPAA